MTRQFPDLPDEAQNLLAMIAIAAARLNRDGIDEMKVETALEPVFEKAELVALMLAALLDRVVALEQERDALRIALQKIGRKSFWASKAYEEKP